MGVAKSDFFQMCRSRLDLIMNAERFARIDLDQSRFEKECSHYHLTAEWEFIDNMSMEGVDLAGVERPLGLGLGRNFFGILK